MSREAQPIGLAKLIEELGLQIPAPAVRSEAVRGARRTKISDDSVLTPAICHALRTARHRSARVRICKLPGRRNAEVGGVGTHREICPAGMVSV